MSRDYYIAPSVELIGLEPADIIASSPYTSEDIGSSGDVIDWDWY